MPDTALRGPVLAGGRDEPAGPRASGRVRLVIFDLDGTLVDSEGTAVRAFEQAYTQCGGTGPAPVDAFLAAAGLPFEQICARLRLPAGMAESFRAASRRRLGELACYAGIEALLRALTARGLRLAVLTGKDRARALEILDLLRLDRHFQAVVTPDDPPRGKPHPDGVRWLCDEFRVPPGETVMIGDSVADLRAGRAAGVRTIGCLWGAGMPPALRAQRPDHLVETVADLDRLLAQLTAGETVPYRSQKDLMNDVRIARIPGSKSLTNRILVLSAGAAGRSVLHEPLDSDDTRACAAALRAMGYAVDDADPRRWVVEGTGQGPTRDRAEIWCADAGTAARFLPPLAATGHGRFTFDGSDQLRRRPLGPLLDSLADLGAGITRQSEADLPFELSAAGLAGGPVAVASTASSQFLSGLLMAGPLMAAGLQLAGGPRVSRPYIDMTVALMARFGVQVSRGEDGSIRVPAGAYRPTEILVEPDASTASYFFAAAALTGTEIVVPGLGANSPQGDLRFVEILRTAGARVTVAEDSTTVAGPPALHGGFTVDMNEISDTMMTLAAIAPYLDAPITITGVGHTRLKESDRVAVMAANLAACGITVAEAPDRLTIHPGQPEPATIACHRDHRIAMSFAVLGLRADGIVLDDPNCVRKTFPGFFAEFGRLFGAG
jgi:3-phosphoshikimate 1-carboxyvinyltransferase